MKDVSRCLDWGLAVVTVLAAIGSVQRGSRIALIVENVSFVTLLVLIYLLFAMAWWRLRCTWMDQAFARWRTWTSLAGCVAFSVGLGLPTVVVLGSIFVGMGFGPRWDYKLLMFGFGLAAFLLGIVAVKNVRFPVMLGGLMVSVVALILPQGV